MLGLAEPNLGHLTASGTIANLEALWVARELHPDKGVAYGANAHYTHARMCQVLRMPARAVPADARRAGSTSTRSTPAARAARSAPSCSPAARPGSAPSTAIDEALALRERHGVRIHVDAAYGGFFTLLDDAPAGLRAIGARRLGRHRPAQARPPAVRVRGRAVRRSRRRAPLRARLAVHVLHVRRAAPGRDQPRVLARRGGRRRAVADAARGAARSRSSPPPAAPALAFAARLRESEALRAAPRARARHRHLPARRRPASRESTPPSRGDPARRHGRPGRPGVPQHAAASTPPTCTALHPAWTPTRRPPGSCAACS